MPFLLKKILSPLFMPLCLSLEILLAGVILLWFTRRQRLGKILTTAGLLMLVALSLPAIANPLLATLEDRYPPLPGGTAPAAGALPAGVPWIVVLGGGMTDDPRVPATSRISQESLARLAEAVRLYRLMPGCRLIFSGGAAFGRTPEAVVMAQVAGDMGIPSRDILTEGRSKDTEEQASLIGGMVGKAPFVLVTSAAHMPRSVALFRKQGMAPIPAPAAFQALEDRNPAGFHPAVSALRKSEAAFHEYLGCIWSSLRDRL